MEARGFGAPGRRFRREPHLKTSDWVLMAAAAGLFGAVVL
jgi:energy-coupling factor transporter transmembrane protein EcfT